MSSFLLKSIIREYIPDYLHLIKYLIRKSGAKLSNYFKQQTNCLQVLINTNILMMSLLTILSKNHEEA